MGKGIYGIEVAANNYFGKPAKKLSPYQSALIVASLPNPLRFNPAKPSAYLSRRAKVVLDLSYKIGTVKFDEKSIEKAKERHEKYRYKKTNNLSKE